MDPQRANRLLAVRASPRQAAGYSTICYDGDSDVVNETTRSHAPRLS